MTLELGQGPGRAVARLSRVLEVALAELDLSVPQFRVLAFLADVDEAAASALAGRLAVSRPSVTALVDGLVARGLVERRPDDIDRRRVGHALTAVGRDALAAADATVERHLASVASHLSDAVARRAVDGLNAWHVAITRARDEALAAVRT